MMAFQEIERDVNHELIVAELDEMVIGTLHLMFLPSISFQGGLRAQDLRVKNNVTNTTYQIDIDADGVVVRDSSKLLQLFDLDLTASITASRANGLDTGSEASSTWYYIWVIHNSSTSTTASLLSTSSSAPTMPSGYTYKFLVGAVKNDGSSDFLSFSQIGNEVWYTARHEEANNLTSLTYVTVDLTDTIPSASNKVKTVLFGATCATADTSVRLSSDGTNARTTFDASYDANGIGGLSELYDTSYASPIFIPISGNDIYYKLGAANATILYTRAWTWGHF